MKRFFMFAGIALAAAWCVYATYRVPPLNGTWGLSWSTPHLSDIRVMRVTRVQPNLPAANAGIVPGDVLRALVTHDIIAAYPTVGEHVSFEVVRGNTRRTVTLTAVGYFGQRYWAENILFLCEIISLGLAFLLVLRRWGDPAARALTLYFVFQAITLAPFRDIYALRYAFPFQPLAIFLGYAGLVRFTGIYPPRARPSRLRAAFAFWAPLAVVATCIVLFLDGAFSAWLWFGLVSGQQYRALSLICADILPAIGLILGIAFATAVERKRLSVLLAFFLVGISGPIAYDIMLATTTIPNFEVRPLLATLVIMYAGFVYVVLRHRFFDIAFVLNRAAIYAVLTSILVPVFALLEWLADRYVSGQNRTENVLVQAGIILILFLSIRRLQGYVERFVDTILFRERYENEAALRDFARHVAFMSDAQKIASQAVQTVCARTDASWSAIYEAARSGPEYGLIARCGEHSPPTHVDEDDPSCKDRNVEATSILRYELTLVQYIKPFIGDLKTDSLRGDRLDKLYGLLMREGGLKKRPLSGSTVKYVHDLLNASYKWAVRKRLVSRNPVADADPPSRGKVRGRATQLDDAHTIIKAIHGHRMEAPLLLAIATGMRRGEVRGYAPATSIYRPVLFECPRVSRTAGKTTCM